VKEIVIDIPGEGTIIIKTDGRMGSMDSDLKEPCPHCESRTCNYDCDGSKGANEEHADDEGRAEFNAAIDGLESLVLAMAVAGLDVTSAKFRDCLQTSLTAITSNHGH